MTTVYGIPLSPFARKVILALETKGIEYTVNPVTPMDKPEGFEKISPLGKIPAIKDDMVTLADSSVICDYLEQRYPEISIYPEGLLERTQTRWLEEYADTAVIGVAGPIFFERIVKTKLMGQEADEARVQEVISEEMPKVYGYLNNQLGDTGFLVGDSLTVADFSVGSSLINAMYAGVDVDAAQWPKLAAYKERLFATELFSNRLAADKAMMDS